MEYINSINDNATSLNKVISRSYYIEHDRTEIVGITNFIQTDATLSDINAFAIDKIYLIRQENKLKMYKKPIGFNRKIGNYQAIILRTTRVPSKHERHKYPVRGIIYFAINFSTSDKSPSFDLGTW